MMQNTSTPKRIVITGGPGTGKTSLIHALEESGHPCFQELIRTMTLKAKRNRESTMEMAINPLNFVDDPLSFNQKLLDGRLRQFKDAQLITGPYIFYDRGLPDVLAYMDYFKQEYGSHFIAVCLEHRYDMVLLLPPWKEIYVQDNERMENFKEARDIHGALEKKYRELGYAPISVPTGPILERVRYVANLIRQYAQ